MFVKICYFLVSFGILLHEMREPKSNKWWKSEFPKNVINEQKLVLISIFNMNQPFIHRRMPTISRTCQQKHLIYIYRTRFSQNVLPTSELLKEEKHSMGLYRMSLRARLFVDFQQFELKLYRVSMWASIGAIQRRNKRCFIIIC